MFRGFHLNVTYCKLYSDSMGESRNVSRIMTKILMSAQFSLMFAHSVVALS